MFASQWNLFTAEEAKEQLLKLLQGPSFVDNIIYEPKLDLDGNTEQITFVFSEESGKLNKYKTNEFCIRFDRDFNEISEYGFLVTSIRPIKP